MHTNELPGSPLLGFVLTALSLPPLLRWALLGLLLKEDEELAQARAADRAGHQSVFSEFLCPPTLVTHVSCCLWSTYCVPLSPHIEPTERWRLTGETDQEVRSLAYGLLANK